MAKACQQHCRLNPADFWSIEAVVNFNMATVEEDYTGILVKDLFEMQKLSIQDDMDDLWSTTALIDHEDGKTDVQHAPHSPQMPACRCTSGPGDWDELSDPILGDCEASLTEPAQNVDSAAGKPMPGQDPGIPELPQAGLLPFRANFYLPIRDSYVAVCEHLSQAQRGGVSGIVFFLPDNRGGVGPGCAPGQVFDDAAIFPMVAEKLTEELNMPVDCYRLSWPQSTPDLGLAMESILTTLHIARQKALRKMCPIADQELRLYFVGHGFGGAVAIEAASSIAKQEQHWARGHGVGFRLAGLCTLNTILLKEQLPLSTKEIHWLSTMRILLLVGGAGSRAEFASHIHEVLPAKQKELRVLSEGARDLFGCKTTLVEEVSHFIFKDFV